jgi:hypothetical protein
MRQTLIRQRLFGLFLTGFLLCNDPLLSCFGSLTLIGAIPGTYGYLLLVWLGLVVIAAWWCERQPPPSS